MPNKHIGLENNILRKSENVLHVNDMINNNKVIVNIK